MPVVAVIGSGLELRKWTHHLLLAKERRGVISVFMFVRRDRSKARSSDFEMGIADWLVWVQINYPGGIPWAAKLIIALWDYLHRIWTFRNGVLHENNQGHISRYKVEALQRKIEVVWGRYNVQQGRMDATLKGNFQQREIINNLIHDSKACWTALATLYLDETENTTALVNPGLETFLVRRSGIG
jgi:hypothetical protein